MAYTLSLLLVDILWWLYIFMSECITMSLLFSFRCYTTTMLDIRAKLKYFQLHFKLFIQIVFVAQTETIRCGWHGEVNWVIERFGKID